MATNLTGITALQISTRLSQALDMSTPQDNLTRKAQINWSNGGGPSQVDRQYHDQRTLGVGSHDDLSFKDGTLLDGLGQAITLSRVKQAYVKASESNSGNIIFANSHATMFRGPLGSAQLLQPGALSIWAAPNSGYAITSGTNHTLRISNASSASAVYDIIITGVSSG